MLSILRSFPALEISKLLTESVESKLNHKLLEERFNLIYRSLNCSSLLHEAKSKTPAIKIMGKTLFIYDFIIQINRFDLIRQKYVA
jgi:hypothetical protein